MDWENRWQRCGKATILGTGHLLSFFIPSLGHLDHSYGGICPFFKENVNARGLAQEGGDGHGWN